MIKFKLKELPAVKKSLIAKQKNVCPICSGRLANDKNSVVDHNHDTGAVRGALHRGCNGVEGKVLKLMVSWGKCIGTKQVIERLEALIAYWKLHAEPQTGWIYYRHKTEAEKRVAASNKRKSAALTKKLAKGV